MRKIKSHIEKNEFSKIYLLYGTDEYMKKNYKEKLTKAIVGDDTMNLSIYNEGNIDLNEIISMATTMPFFADRRLILIEKSKWCANSNDFVDYLDNVPDTTYFIFVEDDVDKRSRLYKYIKDNGYACEMNGLEQEDLLAFIAQQYASAGKRITKDVAIYMLEHIGTDMNLIRNECEKVISYTMYREGNEITRQDIDEMCVFQLENKIFAMLDNLVMGRRKEALQQYDDLIKLREPSLKILRMISRHFNMILLVKEGKKAGLSEDDLCKKLRIRPFALRKYINQGSKYDTLRLIEIVNQCVDYDEKIKTGNMADKIAVDILMCSL